MKELYLVTGGTGHLGINIVNKLVSMNKLVRVLVLKKDTNIEYLPKNVEIFYGDVTDKESLVSFFNTKEEYKKIVIHCAGIISIKTKKNPLMEKVNIGGTKNIISLSKEYNVSKLLYVSSVHAITEPEDNKIIKETTEFDPDKVIGSYAKTKATATSLVLKAGKEGLNVNVVHPSGIMGPNDYLGGHITQLVVDYYNGSLTAGVNGGYDFVDVRDVTNGIISCIEKGKPNECYILSNKFYTVRDIFNILYKITGKHKIKIFIPLWIAKLTAPLSEVYYKIKNQPPLYTKYSLYTLKSNANFTNQKAKKELGYETRSFEETLKDTVDFLKKINRI